MFHTFYVEINSLGYAKMAYLEVDLRKGQHAKMNATFKGAVRMNIYRKETFRVTCISFGFM